MNNANDIAARRKPIRTCVGCRTRDEQVKLLRVCVRDGRVALDPGRRSPGRGAYVHNRPECVERAARRGGLARGLRRSVDRREADSMVAAAHALLHALQQESQELTQTESHVQ